MLDVIITQQGESFPLQEAALELRPGLGGESRWRPGRSSGGAAPQGRVGNELTLALFGPRRASAGGTAATPRTTLPSSGAASSPPTRITTTRGLGRAGTACLPVPSTAESTIPSWRRNTPTPTRTCTNPTGPAAPPADTATTHGTASECGDWGKPGSILDTFAIT